MSPLVTGAGELDERWGRPATRWTRRIATAVSVIDANSVQDDQIASTNTYLPVRYSLQAPAS